MSDKLNGKPSPTPLPSWASSWLVRLWQPTNITFAWVPDIGGVTVNFQNTLTRSCLGSFPACPLVCVLAACKKGMTSTKAIFIVLLFPSLHRARRLGIIAKG